MKSWVLVTFHHNPVQSKWLVYGYFNNDDIEFAGAYASREAAMKAAHKFGCPVIEGRNNIEQILERLQ